MAKLCMPRSLMFSAAMRTSSDVIRFPLCGILPISTVSSTVMENVVSS